MKKIFMAIIIAGLFVVTNLSKATELPQTTCDGAQINTPHMASGALQEDGTRFFRYGSAQSLFVSQNGAQTQLRFDLLFEATEETVIKVLFMDANCTVGAGYAFQQTFPSSNTFIFDSLSDSLVINANEPIRIILNALARYIWLEVGGTTEASYSYLVDLQNIHNPVEGSRDEGGGMSGEEGETDPEVRLTPDPVIIIPGILGSQDKNGAWIMDPILHTYTDLIETFRANGYREDYDLFPFPYDWRNSNIETAAALRWRITEAKNLCQCDKVDIVAHSMGGLVARQYIQSSQYGDDVDQLIFLGTPHLGAPKAYMIWSAGEVGEGVADWALKFMLTQEGKKQGYSDFLSYVHAKIPSVSELLPIFDYLRDGEAPANQFLKNLEEGLPDFYDSITEITNIAGELEGNSTIRHITADSLEVEKGIGDGTVPQISGEHIHQNLKTFGAVSHSQLPTKTVSEVFYILTGQDPETVSDQFNFPDVKLLLLKMLSPADMLVTAPDGKRIGKNFATNQEINEIAGAFYSGFLTDNEFVTILNPSEGNYQIVTQGTGSGEYTVATAYITKDGTAEEELTSSTELGQVETLDFVVGALPRSDLGSVSSISGGGGGGGGNVAPEETSSGEVLGVSINIIRDGTLVLDSTDDRTVYMIGDGKKHGFVSAEVFLGMGFKFEQVISEDLSSYEPGELIESASQQHPAGSLVWDGQTIWLVSNNSRYGFASLGQYLEEGFNLSHVVKVNAADLNLLEDVYAN